MRKLLWATAVVLVLNLVLVSLGGYTGYWPDIFWWLR